MALSHSDRQRKTGRLFTPELIVQEFSAPKRYLLTLLIVGAGTGLQYLLWPAVNPAPTLLMYPAVVFASLYGVGRLSVLLSVLAIQYFFVPPMFSLQINGLGDVIRLGIYVLSALMVCELTNLLHSLIRENAKVRRGLEHEKELLERFIATLTHDLRTPLTAAKTSAQILIRYDQKRESWEKQTMRIIDSIDRADQMIQDLLDVSRIRAGQRLPIEFAYCDLAAIVKDAIEELASIHGERFVVKAEKPIPGYWHGKSIRRLVENLASNAVKYGYSKSPVILALKEGENTVEISVHNSGSYIKPEEQLNLFEPFVQLQFIEGDRSLKGWGLGLALVRGITDAHGGEISIDSSPEEGTTFRIKLPKDSRSATHRITRLSPSETP